jgi:hypothetical protein
MDGRKQVPDGAPIPNYFPALLTEAEFYQLQRTLDLRKRNVKGRAGKGIANLFGKVLVSGYDGSTMVFKQNGTNRNKLLISIKSEYGMTRYPTFPYPPFEWHFLNWVREVELGDTTSRDAAALRELEGQLVDLRARIEQASNAATSATGQTFTRLLDLVAKLEQQERQLATHVEMERAKQHKPTLNTADISKLVDEMRTLPEAERTQVRARLKVAIQNAVERIHLYSFGHFSVSRFAVVHVQLRDGTSRVFEILVRRGEQPVSFSTGVAFVWGDYDIDFEAYGRELFALGTPEAMQRKGASIWVKHLRPKTIKPAVAAG